MTSLSIGVEAQSAARHSQWRPRRWALVSLMVGAASSVVFAVILVAVTTTNTTSDDLSFHHTGDYFLTGIGIATAPATAVLLFALRALQPTARPRLTLAGAVLNAVALGVLTAELAASVATSSEARWGGTYVVATLVTFMAHCMFAAGTWRTRLVPRPMLAVWPAVWLFGCFAATGPSPLLLVAFYIGLALIVARRT